MSQPPAAGSALGTCVAVLRVGLGIGLGLFVIGQVLFLFAFNLVDIYPKELKHLRKHRDVWQRLQNRDAIADAEEDATAWPRIIAIPKVGPLLEEWVEDEKTSWLAGKKNYLKPRLDRWARLTGQEQGWSLFAPYVVDWTCLVAVEMRWDDDRDPLEDRFDGKAVVALGGGPALLLLDGVQEGQPRSMLIPSDNHPRDINRFFRFGHFRARRYESIMEMALRKNGDDEETYRARWERQVQAKMQGDSEERGDEDEMFLFLRWRLRRFQKEHPDLPEPRQVILRLQTWTIPPPPGPQPWEWIEEADEPICRWRPGRHLAVPDSLERYLHSEGRFESKKPTRWQLPLLPGKPGSLD